jgi:hypothetical protein
MRNPLFMNQALCTVIGYGTPDINFFSGDAIRVIPNAEGSSMETGLDSSTTTFSTDQSGTFEMDFKQTSVSLDKYQGIWKRQKTAQAALGNIQIFTSAAEPIRLEGCSISNIGQKGTGGKTASAQTVVFNVQKIIYP